MGDAKVLRWWERVGVVHAHPSNVISHAVGIPLLTYFLWQHDIASAMAFGAFPIFVTVLWTYLRWRDKPSLSRAEHFLYERSTRPNLALTVVGVFTFLYGVWSRTKRLLVVVTLGILLLAIFGATRNASRPRR